MTAIGMGSGDKAQDSIHHISRGDCGNGRWDRGGYGAQDHSEVAAGVSPGSEVSGVWGARGFHDCRKMRTDGVEMGRRRSIIGLKYNPQS